MSIKIPSQSEIVRLLGILLIDIRKLFGEFSVDQDDLERIAREYNSRSRTDAKNPDRRSPDDRKPVIQSNTHKEADLARSPAGSQKVKAVTKIKGRQAEGKKGFETT